MAVIVGNVADTTMLHARRGLDDVPPVRTPSGRRPTRPEGSTADKAYDSTATRA